MATAWEAIQSRPVTSIEAEVFEQMAGRSDSDPLSPWADLALALCERITTAETALRSVRAEALDEATRLVENLGDCAACDTAAEIRALAERGEG